MYQNRKSSPTSSQVELENEATQLGEKQTCLVHRFSGDYVNVVEEYVFFFFFFLSVPSGMRKTCWVIFRKKGGKEEREFCFHSQIQEVFEGEK